MSVLLLITAVHNVNFSICINQLFATCIAKENIPKMIIFGVYIVSKSGGLIFNLDNNVPRIEHEKTFTYPLDLVLDYDPKKVSVAFNRKDGINGRRFPWISPY